MTNSLIYYISFILSVTCFTTPAYPHFCFMCFVFSQILSALFYRLCTIFNMPAWLFWWIRFVLGSYLPTFFSVFRSPLNWNSSNLSIYVLSLEFLTFHNNTAEAAFSFFLSNFQCSRISTTILLNFLFSRVRLFCFIFSWDWRTCFSPTHTDNWC